MNGFETRILNYINRPDYEPSTKKDLARALHIKKVDRREFQASVTRLLHSEKLVKMRSGLLAPTQLTRRATNKGPAGLVAGIVKRTSRGAAYVIPHERLASSRLSDIFVSETDVRDAQTGDEVLVRLLKRRGSGGRRIGRIEEVLERAATSFVGTYLEKGGQGHVQMAGPAFRETVRVDDPSAKGARPGDKVVVEMLRFPTPFQRGEGVITKVLGPRGQPGIDTLCIIHEFGLRHEFPPQVLDEARERAAGFDEQDIDDRLDLTNELTITIDPADARDFDDAVSLSRTKLGGWHLGVHIADVSHFVRTDTPLDFEARLRGTSVYLPNRVLPMLPEVISNGVASLQQGRVRYTRSVFIEFSPDILPVHMEFAKSAIKVTRRFAYEDVMSIIRDPDRFRGRISAKVRALILQMHELSKLLRSQRLKNGALSLDMPEIEIDFDKQGEVVGAHRVAQDESHQLIEEFMLAANTAVARSLRERGIGFLR